jgi:hypothetical protein
VGEASKHTTVGSLQHQQAAILGRLDRVLAGQPFEGTHAQGLTPGDQFDGIPGRLVELGKAALDQLGQARRASQLAPPAPHPFHLAQRTSLQPAQDQLA